MLVKHLVCKAEDITTGDQLVGYITKESGKVFLTPEHNRREVHCVKSNSVRLRSPFRLRDQKGEFRSIFEGDIVMLERNKGIVHFGEYSSGDETDKYHFGWFIEWRNCRTWRKDLGFWALNEAYSIRLV